MVWIYILFHRKFGFHVLNVASPWIPLWFIFFFFCGYTITGCFPTLATIPVWIGLYQALSNVANEVLKKLVLLYVLTY